MNVEILGVIATVFIIIAFCMNNKIYIRLLDILGALMYVIYATLIHSTSVFILNIILIIINAYKVIKDVNSKYKED